MSWVKIDDQLHAHEKFLACSLAARGLWLMCVSWVGDKETDGVIPASVARLHGGAQAAKLIAELTDAELWVPCDDGKSFLFKNYLRYNKSHAQLEEERKTGASRQSRFRDNKRRKDSDNGEDNSLPNANSNGVTSCATTPVVSVAPRARSETRIPTPTPNPDIYAGTKTDQTDDSGGSGGDLAPSSVVGRSPSLKNRNGKGPETPEQRRRFIADTLADHPDWLPWLDREMQTASADDPDRYRAGILRNWLDGDGTPPEGELPPVRTNPRRTRLTAAEQRIAEGQSLIDRAHAEDMAELARMTKTTHRTPALEPPR